MAEERRHVARQIVGSMPTFGTWATAINEYETPFGKVGYRQLELLWAIRHGLIPGEQVTPSGIAAFFRVQPSVVTRIVAKLEASGFVTRFDDPNDGRSFHIEISERGVELSKYVEEIYNQEVLDELADFSDDEVAELGRAVEILHRIGGNLLHRRRTMIHRQRSKAELDQEER
jgi:DNA-binding MarR family transcriptional regulator